jgi:lipopolysaccharide transport system ATP-binding protein
MMEAIHADRISKRFRLGTLGEHQRLTEALTKNLRRWISRDGIATSESKEFWALREVNFRIAQGEVVGIIGHNGAGKSTLLKILSRIVTPTSGRVGVRGRVGSLLEVGTGFHPELTGRENIFLNGAILGMKRAEIRQRFDQIVAFAEVEKFLDTPVKRYSSGMTVRLGFSVAAHMEPDVLIIDEVLSVGDQAFQNRCMGKASELGSQGRTILVVSHNLAAIANICTRAMLLDHGTIAVDGTPQQAIELYLQGMRADRGIAQWEAESGPGSSEIRLRSVSVRNAGSEKPASSVAIDQPIRIEITYDVLQDDTINAVQIHLKDENGVFILSSGNAPSMSLAPDVTFSKPIQRGTYTTACELPANFLNDSRYVVSVLLGPELGTDTGAMRKEFLGSWYGPVIRPRLSWETHKSDTN